MLYSVDCGVESVVVCGGDDIPGVGGGRGEGVHHADCCDILSYITYYITLSLTYRSI